jgi:hypothetical protein
MKRYRIVCVRWEQVPPDDCAIPALAAALGVPPREVRLFEGPLQLTYVRAERDIELVPENLRGIAVVETIEADQA